jgi:HEAT repeat protein
MIPTTEQSMHDDAIDSLIKQAITCAEDEQRWAAIEHLRAIASPRVASAARSLSMSSDVQARCVGVDILAQLGLPARTYHELVMQHLLDLVTREQESAVLESIAFAFDHRPDARALDALIRMHQHENADVRHAVVFGLLTRTDERAIAALIHLSRDTDASIRDWATFGLGTQVGIDTPELREALVARLGDEEGDTAGEAMLGLARRKDVRVRPFLDAGLAGGDVGSLPLEAARELADPTLLPLLNQIRTNWRGAKDWQYTLVEEAIRACGVQHA